MAPKLLAIQAPVDLGEFRNGVRGSQAEDDKETRARGMGNAELAHLLLSLA